MCMSLHGFVGKNVHENLHGGLRRLGVIVLAKETHTHGSNTVCVRSHPIESELNHIPPWKPPGL